MITRVRLVQPKKSALKQGGSYFSSPKNDVDFISTGCKTLDLALGGGWAERRIGNVVGDKSVGKTLLMIEACANFARKYSDGKIYYRECESAFQPEYAQVLGMPLENVSFGNPLETVEDLFDDLDHICRLRVNRPRLYIVDSLDALSDRNEMERGIDEKTYGMEKARKMSQLFRRLVSQLANNNITVLIVSQVRSAIGVKFGRQTTRTGGRALDFYASQVLFLSHLGNVTKTVRNQKRATGIRVRAKVDKNKIALPYREVDFTIKFGYGIDNEAAAASWLSNTGGAQELGIGRMQASVRRWVEDFNLMNDEDRTATRKKLMRTTSKRWYDIEKNLLPVRRKYT